MGLLGFAKAWWHCAGHEARNGRDAQHAGGRLYLDGCQWRACACDLADL